MARTPSRESAEDRAIREVAAEDDAAITRLARESGPPPDAQRLSEAEEDAIWGIADPLVDADPDAIARSLLTTGLDQPTLARLGVLQAHPDWAPLYGAPTGDAELAQQYAQAARYPWRWALLEHLPDPEAQVRKAEALDRRYQRAHAAMHEPLNAAPTPHEPLDPAPGVSTRTPGYALPAGAGPTPDQPPAPSQPPGMPTMGG